jgi:hypothetical protein
MARGLEAAAAAAAATTAATAATGSDASADDGWGCVLAKGSFGAMDNGTAVFNALLAASPTQIVRRECLDCNREYQV